MTTATLINEIIENRKIGPKYQKIILQYKGIIQKEKKM